jgi:aminopeptidase-like protein
MSDGNPLLSELESGGMHDLARRLFPIPRSLTGNGVRQTLDILREFLPDLLVHEVPSGTPCFDWHVPDEWNLHSATLTGPDGEVIADAAVNNLHVVGYSEPVDVELTLEDLLPRIFTRPDLPDAIPYVTSYYKRTWGFCIPHSVKERLKPGEYHARIKATLEPGHMTYGELMLPGESRDEVLLSTYICHPSMANNELSGPVVTTWLARWLAGLPDRRLTYRVLFLPETIGSILYLSRHLAELQRHVKAGFVLSCVGDDRNHTYLASRAGDTLADRAALHVLGHLHPQFQRRTYLQRGSDERNYCWPGVDLPVCSVMRTRYGEFPEYHTSLDNLELISEAGLQGSFRVMRRCLECLEVNGTWITTVIGEPQLGRRNLYPTTQVFGGPRAARLLVDILAYCDGKRDLLAVAETLGKPVWELAPHVRTLAQAGLLRRCEIDPAGGHHS